VDHTSPQSSPAPSTGSLNSRRIVARVLDALLLLGVTVLLTHLIEGLAWFGVSLWLTVTYFFLCEGILGQTLGKGALGLRVVSRERRAPTTNEVASRNVIRVFEEPFIALAVLLGSRGRRQRLGDFAAGTTVSVESGAPRPARSPWLLAYPLVWAGLGAILISLGSSPARPPHFKVADPNRPTAEYLSHLQAICRERDQWFRTHSTVSFRSITRHELSYTRRYASLTAPASMGWVRHQILAGRRRLDQATIQMERSERHSSQPARLFHEVVEPRMRHIAGASNQQFGRAGIVCSTVSSG
jgi:uncharacterized RDD family membrane protein YckC